MNKRFLLIISFGVCTFQMNAQSLINDFFKTKPKQEQKENPSNNGDTQDTIIFVDPSGNVRRPHKFQVKIDTQRLDLLNRLCVLRQDYGLLDKRKKILYGYNDQDFFGSIYSLGVKCNQFTLLFDEAVHPWKYDGKYENFKDKKYEPTITSTQFMMLDDSVSYTYTEMDSALVNPKVIKEDLIYAGKKLTSVQDGMILNTTDTCKIGLLVWIEKKSGTFEEGDIKLDFKYVPMQMDMVGNVNIFPPVGSKDILGCLYITESQNSDIPYYLSGVAICQRQQWVLTFPFKGFKFESAKQDNKKTEEKGKLTIIKQPNKKK